MASSSSSSMVISFSIAILLLLILLLLLSYNSKCKNNKVERFENTNSDNSDSYMPSFNKMFDPTLNSLTQFAGGERKKPETNKEKFTNMIEGSPLNSNYSLLDDATTGSECPTNGSDINVAYTTGEFQDPTTCFKRDRLTKTDLLPAEATDKWSQINPSSSGDIADKNFLTAGYHIGINTVGQSMRNANLQLRSEIPNPQVAVSPWLVSTIEPDIRPVSFEIGSAPTASI